MRARIPCIQTDSGRSAVRPDEQNDCTVRALANATGVPYGEAHRFLRDYGGRVDYNGAYESRYGHLFDAACRAVDIGVGMTVHQFSAIYSGTFVVIVSHHIFVVVNGIALDLNPVGKARKIEKVWEVLTVER